MNVLTRRGVLAASAAALLVPAPEETVSRAEVVRRIREITESVVRQFMSPAAVIQEHQRWQTAGGTEGTGRTDPLQDYCDWYLDGRFVGRSWGSPEHKLPTTAASRGILTGVGSPGDDGKRGPVCWRLDDGECGYALAYPSRKLLFARSRLSTPAETDRVVAALPPELFGGRRFS